LLGDGFGSSSGSNEEEGHDTSWLEDIQEKGNTDNQQTNFPNEIMETVLGVTDVNSPSDAAAAAPAAEEGGTVVNGAGNVSQFFCCQKNLTSIARIFTIIFVQETCNVVSTGPNEAVAMSRNLVSMLENAPLADGDGEFFSGEDEISGVGMQKSSSAKKPPKTKNSTNAKRANVGKSIQRLCDSIAKSSEALLSPCMSKENSSQLFALQMFHSQMQNQECKIDAIEKNSKAVGKMMKNY
jgi:hypothetical protein